MKILKDEFAILVTSAPFQVGDGSSGNKYKLLVLRIMLLQQLKHLNWH